MWPWEFAQGLFSTNLNALWIHFSFFKIKNSMSSYRNNKDLFLK